MAATTLPGVLLPAAIHASRPAANAVAGGTLFPCTTHGTVDQSDGVSTWTTWATLGTAGAYTSGGTDVAVADGGTGASTASGARTNLGLVIGTDVQAQGAYAPGGTDVAVADGGTGASSASAARTNLGLVLGTDVASLTSGRVPIAQLASGTPDGTKFIRDDGTLVTPAGGGGGGLAQSYVGYNTVGGTWTTATATRQLMKKVTLAATSHFQTIEAHLRGNFDDWSLMQVGLLTDNAGVPNLQVAVSASPAALLTNAGAGTSTGRWLSVPLTCTVAAGDYWLAVNINGTIWDIASDGSGSDVYQLNSRNGISGNHSGLAKTTGTLKYSIRASILS